MSITSTAPDNITVVRRTDVCEALNISSWTLDRWIRKGVFPPPMYLTPDSNVRVWRVSVINAHLEKRRRARRHKPKPRGMFVRKRKSAKATRTAAS